MVSSLFGKPREPHVQPDTLFSDDVLEAILAISEGPIVGLETGPQSFFLNDTPLVNSSGTPNIGNFDLRIHHGNPTGDVIKPNLGGAGSTVNMNVTLDSNLPVVCSGTKQNIDYIEVRIVINRLYATNTRGEWPWFANFKIEYKPHSSGTWTNPFPVATPPVSAATSAGMRYSSAGIIGGEVVNNYYRSTLFAGPTPGAPTDTKTIWFNTGANYQPKVWNGTAWVLPPGYAYTAPVGATLGYYSWTDGYYQGGSWIASGVVRKAIVGYAGSTPSFGNPQDFWVTPAGVLDNDDPVSYVWNGSSWVDYMDWPVPATYNRSPGDIVIYGKTSSSYVKEIRIKVPRINDTYDIRVTKTNPPNTGTEFSDITFESIQEINAEDLQFDDLALAHLTIRASDQFSSIPTFTGIYKGRTVRVPSNYNPVTKVYTGIWDGVTFNVAYTDNPAWIVYDLVTNDRYGIAAYYELNLDRLATYEFGRHCDAHGFTFNELIQEPRSLIEAIDYICGIAGGRFIDMGGGYATIMFDADDQPATALFTPENVVDGVFSYAFTDITTRKNDLTVSFINPELNWREDRRRVFDQVAIDYYGRNPEEFIAVGCVSEEEAIKRARLRLVMAQTEKAVITFKTNRVGLYLHPFDVILIADDTSGFGIHGRVKAVLSSTSLSLRDPVAFEAGFTYQVSFTVPDGAGLFKIVKHALTTVAGATYTLTLATPLSVTLPANAAFSIECDQTSVGVPKAFRITSIEEADGEPDMISISAMEVNRTKWAYVDGDIDLIDHGDGGRPTRYVLPPSDVKTEGRIANGGIQQIQVSWTPSSSRYVAFYRIYDSFNGGTTRIIAEVKGTVWVYENPLIGVHTFGICAVARDGVESSMVYVEHTVTNLTGVIRPVKPPTNLVLVGGSSSTNFRGREPRIRWTATTDTLFDQYNVRILNPAGGAVVREFYTKGLEYTYNYLDNQTDFGGTPSRTMVFEVRTVDTNGQLSDAATLTVSNPTPSVVTPQITAGSGVINVSFDAPADADIAGCVIWVSPTTGFNPSTTVPDYEGPNTSASFIKVTGTYYIRVGVYDAFGRVGMLISSEIATTVTSSIDTVPPSVPTGLVLSSVIITSPGGSVQSRLTASWTSNTEPDLNGYEVQIKEGAGSYIGYNTSTNTYNWLLRVNTQYTVRIRAVDLSGNKSGWSTEVIHTTAADTTPPAAPTALTVSSAFRTVFINWTNPGDADLEAVEIWENTVNTQPNPTTQTVLRVGVVGATPGTKGAFTRTVLNPTTAYWYWVRAVDTSGNVSGFNAVSGVTATTAAITNSDILDNTLNAAKLQAATLDATKFASSIQPVGTGASLPATSGYTGPKTFFNTTDGKLYRFVGGAWVATIPSTDISGTLTAAQIGQLGVNNFSTTLRPAEVVPSFPIGGNFIGRIIFLTSNSKLYRYDGTGWTAETDGADIKADSITAGALTAGAIGVRELAAESVTASRVAISAYLDNKVINGEFEELDLFGADTAWAAAWARTNTSVTVVTTGAISGKHFLRLNRAAVPATQLWAQCTRWIPVEEGQKFELAGTWKTNVSTPVGCYLRTYFYQEDQITLIATGNAIENGPGTTAWTRYYGTVTVPAGARYAVVRVINNPSSGALHTIMDVDNVSMRKLVGATLIEDGAITTDKIVANAITTGLIAAGAVNTTQLAAKAVKADQLDAGVITSTKLAVGSWNNLLTNGDFDDPGSDANFFPWAPIGTANLYAEATTDTVSGTHRLVMDRGASPTGSWNIVNTIYVPVQGGDWLSGQMTIRGNAASAQGCYYRILFYDQSKVLLSQTQSIGLLSITRAGNVVAVICNGRCPFSVGATVTMAATGNTSANGVFTIAAVDDDTFYFVQTAADLATTVVGGTANSNCQYRDFVANGPISTKWVRQEKLIQVPQAAAFARVMILHHSTSTIRYMYVDKVEMRQAARSTWIADGVITTNHIVVDSLEGDRIRTGSLDADRIKANSILAGSVTVDSTSLSNVVSRANDPAARINAWTTYLLPGKVLISGTTSLADWRNGTDTTKIEGGSIAANTIKANSIEVGARGITITGLTFSTAGNVLSWTKGVITYVDPADSQLKVRNITAGSLTWTTGTRYVYYTLGGTTLSNAASPGAITTLPLATYLGGSNLTATYGRTTIDGDSIVTSLISATQIQTNGLAALNANIGTITAGYIYSANGKMLFNLVDNYLLVSD